MKTERPNIRLKDVAGLKEAKKQISRDLHCIKNPEKAKAVGLIPGRNILLYGNHGVGKTMIARATAGELGVPLITIKLSDVLSVFWGESEGNIARLFESARETARREGFAILLIEEIELFAPRWDNVQGEASQRFVRQFLTDLDALRSDDVDTLVIMTTNKPWDINSALMRLGRIYTKIHVPLPDLEAREELWRIYLEKMNTQGKFDYAELAKMSDGLSGADIAQVCRNAGNLAMDRVMDKSELPVLTVADVLQALHEAEPSVTRDEIAIMDEHLKRSKSHD